jgi:hypothetical protein
VPTYFIHSFIHSFVYQDEHEGCNGYELPSFLHGTASNAIGPNPRARFEVVFHQVRDPLKSLISRANRIGMMYSPIAYANPKLFKLLTEEFRKSSVSVFYNICVYMCIYVCVVFFLYIYMYCIYCVNTKIYIKVLLLLLLLLLLSNNVHII